MSNSVSERVIAVIADVLNEDPAEIKPEKHLEDDLHADSLDTVEMIMDLEYEFDITIHDEDAEKVRTVQDAIDLVNKLI